MRMSRIAARQLHEQWLVCTCCDDERAQATPKCFIWHVDHPHDACGGGLYHVPDTFVYKPLPSVCHAYVLAHGHHRLMGCAHVHHGYLQVMSHFAALTRAIAAHLHAIRPHLLSACAARAILSFASWLWCVVCYGVWCLWTCDVAIHTEVMDGVTETSHMCGSERRWNMHV